VIKLKEEYEADEGSLKELSEELSEILAKYSKMLVKRFST